MGRNTAVSGKQPNSASDLLVLLTRLLFFISKSLTWGFPRNNLLWVYQEEETGRGGSRTETKKHRCCLSGYPPTPLFLRVVVSTVQPLLSHAEHALKFKTTVALFVWLVIKPSPWRPSLLPFPARQVAKTTPKRMPGVITMHSPSDCGSPSQEFSPGDPLECLMLDLATTKNVSHSPFQASVTFKPFAGIFSRCKASD